MSVHPWSAAVLGTRFAELICVALNAAPTTLDPEATRRHIRAALDAGATRDDIVFVTKCASVVSVHALSVAAPELLAEAGPAHNQAEQVPTPWCDAMHNNGQWNAAWDPFLELDAEWTELFMAVGIDIYSTDLFSPKEIELLSIALDASVNHLYAPGIRRHIRTALDLGASTAEIAAVLQLCVSQGMQSCNVAIPILDDELSRKEKLSTEEI
ncbi:carboxymuconolactone decarboxylase family protein [Mycobacterium sp. M26]|uniref:carboxymuconolactone decarboxylase family protein n=1 Tax=Mycobacterium sp. M26 TaxID=1762962 RepID=UPI0009EB2BDA|nr:carboxymuconolactone decarboxylase family protein [Mycobacterium sp. M26]